MNDDDPSADQDVVLRIRVARKHGLEGVEQCDQGSRSRG